MLAATVSTFSPGGIKFGYSSLVNSDGGCGAGHDPQARARTNVAGRHWRRQARAQSTTNAVPHLGSLIIAAAY
jgi:hypothetical protein